MFCLTCQYPLGGLDGSSRCPECGRAFDPDDARTYAASPEDPRAAGAFTRSPAFWLIVLAPLAGVINAMLGPTNQYAAVIFLAAMMSVAWVHMDSISRGLRAHVFYLCMVFIAPMVFVPVHLLVTRGMRGIGLILVAMGVLTIAVGLSLTAGWVTTGVANL